MPFICSRGIFTVPLKFMCSTQCDTPVRPGASSREPTRYQHHTETSGAVWTSCTRIFRPLSRVARRTVVWGKGARDVGIAPLYKPVLGVFGPAKGLDLEDFLRNSMILTGSRF